MPTLTPRRQQISPARRPDVIGPVLIVVAAIAGVGVLYEFTKSIPVTMIAAGLAGTLGTVAQTARRWVYLYRDSHVD